MFGQLHDLRFFAGVGFPGAE